MVWAKLDDEILDNPKIARAGVFGFALHVAAITWCCRNLTDGFIPYARCASLLDLSAVNYDAANPMALPDGQSSMGGNTGLSPHAIASHLADIGLWNRVPGGYEIHDFLVYNPSRKEVLSQREAAKERRKETHEKRRKNVTRTSSERVANVTGSSGRPDPDPDPSVPSERGSPLPPTLVEVVPGNAVNDEPEAPVASPADPPPPWFVEVLAGIAVATGEQLRAPECWLRYAGHRAGTPTKRIGPNDARYWVTTVMVPEARKERQRPPPGAPWTRPAEPKPAPYHRPAKSVLDEPLGGVAVDAEQMAELARRFG